MKRRDLVQTAALVVGLSVAAPRPVYADGGHGDAIAKAPKKKARTDRARTQGTPNHKKATPAEAPPPPKVEPIAAPPVELSDPVVATDAATSGLSVIVAEHPSAASTVVALRLPFGSSADPVDQGGLVAVAAHASILRDVKARATFAAAGGSEAVAVDPDGVTYALTLPGPDATPAFELLAAQLRESIDAASVDAARGELHTDLVGDARALVQSLVYEGDAPYAHRSDGSAVYLAKVQPGSVEAFRAARFQVTGARLAIVTAEHADLTIKSAKATFDGPAGTSLPDASPALPEQTNQRASDIEEAGAPSMLFEAWALRGAGARELDQLDVAASLLGEGGQVEAALAKAGIEGRATAKVERRRGPSVFELEVTLPSDADVVKAKHAIDDGLAEAARRAPSDGDLVKAKRGVSVARAAELDDPRALAVRLASGDGSVREGEANIVATGADEVPKLFAKFLGPLTRSSVETRDPARVKPPRPSAAGNVPAHAPPPKHGAEPKHPGKTKKHS